MSNLDVYTLLFMMLITEATTTMVMLFLYRGGNTSISIKHWVSGKVLAFIATFSLYFRGDLPDDISVLITNAGYMTCYFLIWRASHLFNHRSVSPFIHLWPVVVGMMGIMWYTYIDPIVIMRIFVSASVYGYFSFLMAYEYIRGPEGGVPSIRSRLIGILAAFNGAQFIWMILGLKLDLTESNYFNFGEYSLTLQAALVMGMVFSIGHALGVVLIVNERMQKETLSAYARQGELLEDQKRFLLMLSHEFKNPLAAIDRSAQFLLLTNADQETKYTDRLQAIKSKVTVLSDLVDGILKTENESHAFEDEPVQQFSLQKLWDASFALVNASFGKHRIVVENNLSANVQIFGRFHILASSLTTIVDNALKYSDDSKEVAVTLSEDQDMYHILIADKGIGIPEADLENVTQKYYRGQNVKHISGSGLGLSLAQWAVEKNMGQLAITSIEGEGTDICISLPKIK